MTGAQVFAAFRRAMVPALAAGLAVLGIVVALMMSRPAQYSARIGLVAAPRVSAGSTSSEFGAVVSQTMPALPELAVADGTLTAVRAAVPDAPSVKALRAAITVELVPGSSVARVSVVDTDQARAARLLSALVEQIRKADLLSPVAELKTIGAGPPLVQEAGRDSRLALGLGLFAGLLASLVTVVLVQALRPRLLTAPDVESVVRDVFDDGIDTPPVVTIREDPQAVSLLAAHLMARNPTATQVKVVAAGPELSGDIASRIRNALLTLQVTRDTGVMALGEGLGLPDGADSFPSPALPGGVRHAASRERRPAPFGPLGSGKAIDPDGVSPLAHTVVTVNLGRTTPTALTTALVATRTHGSGVAGVAVG